MDSRIEKDPGNIDLIVDRGFAYAMLGNSGAAVKDFEKAREIDPDSFHLLRSEGWAYLNLGWNRKALEAWEKAFSGNRRDYWLSNHTLAIGHWVNGNRETALQLYDRAAKSVPEDFATRKNLEEFTRFWTWREKEIVFPLFDAWSRGYVVE